MTKHIGHMKGCDNPKCRGNCAVSLSGSNALVRVQFWLAELDRYGNPTLIDGAHSDRDGAEEALTLRKRLPMLSTEDRSFAIAEVRLSEPTSEHGPLNEDALAALGATAP